MNESDNKRSYFPNSFIAFAGYDSRLITWNPLLIKRAEFVGHLYLLECLVLSLGFSALVALTYHVFLLTTVFFVVVVIALVKLRYAVAGLRYCNNRAAHFVKSIVHTIIFAISFLSLTIFILQDALTVVSTLQNTKQDLNNFLNLYRTFILLPYTKLNGSLEIYPVLLWTLSTIILLILLTISLLPMIIRKSGLSKDYQQLKNIHEQIASRP